MEIRAGWSAFLYSTGERPLLFYPSVEPDGSFLAKASSRKVVIVVVRAWKDREAATSQGVCSSS